MNSVECKNLLTGEKRTYVGIDPAEAVIAAHAQEHRDYNTWKYADRYTDQLKRSPRAVYCGDWGAFTDRRP
jgi:hypothetical protein